VGTDADAMSDFGATWSTAWVVIRTFSFRVLVGLPVRTNW
jgi:hypothetical protein